MRYYYIRVLPHAVTDVECVAHRGKLRFDNVGDELWIYYWRIHVAGWWRGKHRGEGLPCHSAGGLLEMGFDGLLDVHVVRDYGCLHCIQIAL